MSSLQRTFSRHEKIKRLIDSLEDMKKKNEVTTQKYLELGSYYKDLLNDALVNLKEIRTKLKEEQTTIQGKIDALSEEAQDTEVRIKTGEFPSEQGNRTLNSINSKVRKCQQRLDELALQLKARSSIDLGGSVEVDIKEHIEYQDDEDIKSIIIKNFGDIKGITNTIIDSNLGHKLRIFTDKIGKQVYVDKKKSVGKSAPNIIRLNCPHCGKELLIPKEYAGQEGTCNYCGNRIQVPHKIDESKLPDSPADFGRRCKAFLVDFVVLFPFVIYTSFFIALPHIQIIIETWASEEFRYDNIFLFYGTMYVSLTFIIFCLFFLVYSAFFESIFKATLGKFIAGIYVSNKDFKRISVWRSIWRYFMKLFLSIPLGLGFFFMLLNKQKKALYDKVSGTQVLCSRSNFLLKNAFRFICFFILISALVLSISIIINIYKIERTKYSYVQDYYARKTSRQTLSDSDYSTAEASSTSPGDNLEQDYTNNNSKPNQSNIDYTTSEVLSTSPGDNLEQDYTGNESEPYLSDSDNVTDVDIGHPVGISIKGLSIGMSVYAAQSALSSLVNGIYNLKPWQWEGKHILADIDRICLQAGESSSELRGEIVKNYFYQIRVCVDPEKYEVLSIEFNPEAVNILFDVSDLSAEEFVQRFVNQYEIPSMTLYAENLYKFPEYDLKGKTDEVLSQTASSVLRDIASTMVTDMYIGDRCYVPEIYWEYNDPKGVRIAITNMKEILIERITDD